MATPLPNDFNFHKHNIWSPLPTESKKYETLPLFPFPSLPVQDSKKEINISLRELRREKLIPKELYIEIFGNK